MKIFCSLYFDIRLPGIKYVQTYLLAI